MSGPLYAPMDAVERTDESPILEEMGDETECDCDHCQGEPCDD